MATDAIEFNRRQFRKTKVDVTGRFDVNSELVLAQAGRDIGMSSGVDIGVHAKCDGRALAHFSGDTRDAVDFRFRLAVEAVDILVERKAYFIAGLAYTGKNNFARVGTGREHSK